jgi:Phage integrase family
VAIRLPLTRSGMATNDLKQVLTAYKSRVLRQPLAKNTQEAYRFHVLQYGEYLAMRPSTGYDSLCHPFARDYAVRDFKRYLQTERKAKPASVNLTLAAIDLELAAHVLRHTYLTNLVRRGHDLVLVAEVAGHKHLETTRRYRLPSPEDRDSTLEGLRLEY